jgi:hypothetical protein
MADRSGEQIMFRPKSRAIVAVWRMASSHDDVDGHLHGLLQAEGFRWSLFLRTSDGSVALTAGAHGCLCFFLILFLFPSGLRDEIMDLRCNTTVNIRNLTIDVNMKRAGEKRDRTWRGESAVLGLFQNPSISCGSAMQDALAMLARPMFWKCRVAELTHYTATGLRQAYRIAAYRSFVTLSGSSAPKRPNKTNAAH